MDDRLYKMGIVQTPLCSLCKQEKETVIHLLCQCHVNGQLWCSLSGWLQGVLRLPPLEPVAAMLGSWEYLVLVNKTFICFLICQFLPESARFYVTSGQPLKAIEMLNKVSEGNGKELPKGRLKEVHQVRNPMPLFVQIPLICLTL